MFEVPAESVFECKGTREICQPHPYCITPKHVGVAADHHGGMLNEAAIEDAESRGAKCGIHGCQKKLREHEKMQVLVVVIPDDAPKDLNQIPGLGAWLTAIKPQMEAEGIKGVVVPRKSQFREEAAA